MSVLSLLVCIVQGRLLIASLTAGLNIVPITDNLSVMSCESSRGNISSYYHNLGSLRAETRHRECRCLAARPAKRRSVSYSDVFSRTLNFILPLSLSVFACDLHSLQQLASHLDWREPIGLQESLEGKEFP